MTVVVFDLETGGLLASHPIIQIAGIAVADDFAEELDTFEAKILFDVTKADPEALKLNHYDAEVWKRLAYPEVVVLTAFGEFCRRHATLDMISKAGKPYRIARLAGHGVKGFDCPRIMEAFKRNRLFLPATAYQPLDTYELALWHFHGCEAAPVNLKLPTLAQWFGLDVEGAHDALADCRLSLGIARAMRSCEKLRA